MKIKILIFVLCALLFDKASSQINAINDNYSLRSDTGLNYNLYVRNNDSIANGGTIKIYSVTKLGASANFYIANIVDSSYISIQSSSADTFSGVMKYLAKDINSGAIDSAFVNFSRGILTPSVRPGDANLDSLVNHFDLFPIGVLYKKYGEARHNLDTNIDFNVPKRAANWLINSGGVNGKYADIDGNGIINAVDVDKLKLNLGKSSGTYIPKLSDSNSLNKFWVNSKDTFILSDIDSFKIKLPIEVKFETPQVTYGLGFTYSILNQNKNTLQDTFYSKHTYTVAKSTPWTNQSISDILYLEDKKTRSNYTNIAYCKTNLQNGGMTGEAGVVEVVVEEILWGITKPSDIARLRISIKDVALIDKDYNLIPIKPISKYVYIKKAFSGLSNAYDSPIKVYPTIVTNSLIIEKDKAHFEQYFIYNAIGQLIQTGILNQSSTSIFDINWTSGFYYLKLENSSKVIKLQKL